MVTVGRDHDGAKFVVGRAKHAGDLLPAKAKPEHGVAYVSYDGLEHIKHDFEVCTWNNKILLYEIGRESALSLPAKWQ